MLDSYYIEHIDTVSYTHLDVYKRQRFLVVSCKPIIGVNITRIFVYCEHKQNSKGCSVNGMFFYYVFD